MRLAAIAVLAACGAPQSRPRSDVSTLAGRFQLGSRDRLRERQVSSWLGAGAPYTLECRERICRLAAVELGSHGYVALYDRLAPATRPLRAVQRVGTVTYVEIETDDVLAARAEIEQLPATFRASGPYAECLAEHAERGDLRLHVGWAGRLPVVTSEGDLEGTQLDRCLRAALELVASRVHLPGALVEPPGVRDVVALSPDAAVP